MVPSPKSTLADPTRRLAGAFPSELVTVRVSLSPANSGLAETSRSTGLRASGGKTVGDADNTADVDRIGEGVGTVGAEAVGIGLAHPQAINAVTASAVKFRCDTDVSQPCSRPSSHKLRPWTKATVGPWRFSVSLNQNEEPRRTASRCNWRRQPQPK
jgi:hypothetical protein